LKAVNANRVVVTEPFDGDVYALKADRWCSLNTQVRTTGLG